MIWRVFLLALFPVALAADSVSIRSGEHDTFSRLVLSIGTGTEWEVVQSEEGFVLELDGSAEGFDVSQVFERIPRDRIVDIAQTSPNALQLSVDCACDIDAFIWKPGELVVDIVDGVTLAVGEEVTPDVPEPILGQFPIAETVNTPVEFPNFLLLVPPESAPFSVEMPLITQPLDIEISATEKALAEGIARAASQGFLTPAITATVPPDTMDAELDEAGMAIATSEPTASITLRRPGVGISTALDRELAQLGAALDGSINRHCLPSDLFDTESWGDGRNFHDQASDLAESLAGEFGEEPLDAQDDLARLYIHFGFGAEARALLGASTASSQSRLVLMELAGIIDDYDGEYPLIAGQYECGTSGALWSFLIDPTPQESDSRNQLIQQFLALPQPLRGHMAPRMAKRFIEVGDAEAADRLLNTTDNKDAAATHDVQATRAFLAEDQNDAAGAVTLLSQEVNDNARTTPQSLIRLIELQLAQGIVPAEADLLLAAAMRQEHRGTQIAQDLADTEATGRIAITQYQVALDIVNGRNDVAAIAIVDHVFADLTTQSDSGTFLGFAFGELPENLTAETENAMAERLIDLGFADRADVLLQGPADRDSSAERRYLRAEAAIGTEDYLAVIDSLQGMSDDRARTLRAQAYEGLGEHRSALESLTPDQVASTPSLQFRASAWDRLTAENDDVLSTFATAVLTPPITESVETLADRRALLLQSQESRQAIQDLLLRFDGMPPSE